MTPKRKKWWDSLPATQKYLRREISSLWIESQKPDEDYSWVGDEMPLRKKEVK